MGNIPGGIINVIQVRILLAAIAFTSILMTDASLFERLSFFLLTCDCTVGSRAYLEAGKNRQRKKLRLFSFDDAHINYAISAGSTLI